MLHFSAPNKNPIPIGEKRKPGRPTKAKQALIVQRVLIKHKIGDLITMSVFYKNRKFKKKADFLLSKGFYPFDETIYDK
ncbi:hypothetical protein BpHYR1_018553 [Brachionus plicatilis]|uniref:Uncharacterized protein n=1 Tax=Brachionus plicatilis TaxID=10195 RepID=A0A3M7P9Q7_BRAPC|nr:hypothetical protein BpHYR1_018553 [Brachionus plicatilis]